MNTEIDIEVIYASPLTQTLYQLKVPVGTTAEEAVKISGISEIFPEINLLISGEMVLNGVRLSSGDVFILDPYEITDVQFTKECSVVCVKTPSIPDDKIVVIKS